MEAIKESIDKSTQFFLETTEKPMAVIELDGTVYKMNENFTKFFNIDQNENIMRIVSSQSVQRFEETLKRIQPKQSKTCHFCMIMNSQKEYVIKADIYYNDQANLIVLLFTMPAEMREKQKKYWSSEFMYADSLLMLCTDDGRIQEVNHLSFEYFNLPTEYFIGKDIDLVLSLFTEKSFDTEKVKQQILERKPIEITERYHHPIKGTQYYKIDVITEGTSNSFLLKIKDCTEKTKLKRQLKEADSSLEVAQLATTIVHEVRNPMTTLKGFTQLLKGTANEDAMKYLTVIDDEIERMESILSEMLTLSKPTKSIKKPLSMKKLLNHIIQVITPKATIEKITVIHQNEVDEEVIVLGDEGRLKQVFLNLFKNGLEAMQPGGILTVYVQYCGEDELNIIIEDTGKGIEEVNLTQMFMPYFTTKPDGTGLGMPFVLQTIEDHHGTIAVSSEVGKGTSFILTLPIKK